MKDVLWCHQGRNNEVDKPAGEQVSIIVNGKKIARGEVVVVNDNFGVRISEILKQEDLIKITMW